MGLLHLGSGDLVLVANLMGWWDTMIYDYGGRIQSVCTNG